MKDATEQDRQIEIVAVHMTTLIHRPSIGCVFLIAATTHCTPTDIQSLSRCNRICIVCFCWTMVVCRNTKPLR